MINKSIEQTVKWLKKHRTNEHGDIDLRGMVIDGSIDISGMKVKGYLWQDYQTAGGFIFQSNQTAHCMELQNTQGMEKDEEGFWVKKKTLEERVNELDIDNDLKKEIIENLKEKQNDRD